MKGFPDVTGVPDQDDQEALRQWMALQYSALFNLLPVLYPGSMTLNQARVRTAVITESLADRPCTMTGLSELLGIPQSTVSRAIGDMQEEGLLETVDAPEDGRIRAFRYRLGVIYRPRLEGALNGMWSLVEDGFLQAPLLMHRKGPNFEYDHEGLPDPQQVYRSDD